MKEFEFLIKLDNIEIITCEIADALFKSGCDDCLPYSTNKSSYLVFNREAESFQEAYRSAISNILQSGIDFKFNNNPDRIPEMFIHESYSNRDDARARRDYFKFFDFNIEMVKENNKWLIREKNYKNFLKNQKDG